MDVIKHDSPCVCQLDLLYTFFPRLGITQIVCEYKYALGF